MVVSDALSRAAAPIEDDEPHKSTYVDHILPLEDVTTHEKLSFADPTSTIHEEYNKLYNNQDSTSSQQINLNNIILQNIKIPQTTEEWKIEQIKDQKLLILKNKIINKDKICSKSFIVEHDVLYKITNGLKLIVIPSHMYNDVIYVNHDNIIGGGHLGFLKTIHKIQNQFYFKNLKDLTRKYIKSCHVCQLTKSSNVAPYGYLSSHYTSVPNKAISVDLIGPLVRTSNLNEHALVIVDDFTRFPVIYPLRNPTAKIVSLRLLDYCTTYGFPESIRSDNGP
jgi:hypothetical protein